MYVNSESLERAEGNTGVGSFIVGRMPIAKLKSELAILEKQAKKEGYKDITVDLHFDRGDENNLDSSELIVSGTRLETEEEWHKRLESIKTRKSNTISNAAKIMERSKVLVESIESINEALSKSSLKCEECKNPCSYTTYHGGWKHSRRVCYECLKKIMEEEK
jgi:hypothetical protein